MSIGRTIARCMGVVLLAAMLAGGTFGANALTDNADPRLDKKVTIAVVHTKLEDVVKQLSEQSGVEIKAGTGARDWKVLVWSITTGSMLMARSGHSCTQILHLMHLLPSYTG